ncbi:MAG: hypothetical protein RID11_14485 [Roseovarius sp.]|jgi:hypothetical protein|uniref:hypothetical protein n=1 Tax=Roseovarius sp. TaxID=1486281 RepID=UPI0032EF8447
MLPHPVGRGAIRRGMGDHFAFQDLDHGIRMSLLRKRISDRRCGAVADRVLRAGFAAFS